jgi:hypothetical protein
MSVRDIGAAFCCITPYDVADLCRIIRMIVIAVMWINGQRVAT